MKIKLLLLSLLTPLLFGVSFGFNPLSNFNNTVFNIANGVSSFTYNLKSGYEYCVYIGEGNGYINGVNIVQRSLTAWGQCSTVNINVSNSPDGFACFEACDSSSLNFVYQYNDSSLKYYVYEFENPISVGGDCSSLEEDLLECSNELNSCELDLTSCQNSNCDTQLSQCIIDKNNCLDDNSFLSGNLSSCISDKNSLQNYNDSLSSQLNECLSNSDGTGELLSGDCLQNSLFWLDNDNMLSLPITNNLFLPNGYGAYLTTGNVLGISSLEDHSKVYEFDSGAKETTVNSIAYIMLFLIATGLIMVLLRFLKRLFKL